MKKLQLLLGGLFILMVAFMIAVVVLLAGLKNNQNRNFNDTSLQTATIQKELGKTQNNPPADPCSSRVWTIENCKGL